MSPSISLQDDLLCGACRQNLRGVPDGRCPECGRAFRRDQLLTVRVAWEQRREIGRRHAYLATLLLILRRPAALARYADAPVDYVAARSFRRWTILWATLDSAAMAQWMLRGIKPSVGTRSEEWPLFWGAGWSHSAWDVLTMFVAVANNSAFFVTSAVATAIWLAAVTGTAARFFNDARLDPAHRARAAALGQYGAAPFAWVLCVVLLASLSFTPVAEALHGGYADLQPRWELVGITLLLLMIPGFWLVSSARLLRRATGCSVARQWCYVLTLPPLAVIWAVCLGAGVHFVVFHATLMWAGW